MRRPLITLMSVILLSLTLKPVHAGEYFCEQAYNQKIAKYEKSSLRKVGRIAVPTTGVLGAWGLMVAQLGLEGAYMVTVCSPAVALPELTDSEIEIVAASLQTGIRDHNIFDTFLRKVSLKGKNQKYSYEQVRNKCIELAQTDAFCPKEKMEKENWLAIKRWLS